VYLREDATLQAVSAFFTDRAFGPQLREQLAADLESTDAPARTPVLVCHPEDEHWFSDSAYCCCGNSSKSLSSPSVTTRAAARPTSASNCRPTT
jgi:hypothetical protein